MSYYPIFLDLRSRKTLVVGAGRVAERKVKSLLQVGARVTVVAPHATPGLRKLAKAGKIRWLTRRYRASDIARAALVFSATGLPAVERKVAADAARRGIPANCASLPELGTFRVPAQARRGEIQIAVSTGGASPSLARRVALELRKQIPPEYAAWARLLSRLRPRILASAPRAARARLLRELASEKWLRLLRQNGLRRTRPAVDRAPLSRLAFIFETASNGKPGWPPLP